MFYSLESSTIFLECNVLYVWPSIKWYYDFYRLSRLKTDEHVILLGLLNPPMLNGFVSFPVSGDITEDILEKYRRKQPNHSGMSIASDASRISGPEPFDQDITDEVNIHSEAFMFENAKKKLRFVLSNTEIQQLPCAGNNLHNLVCFF